MIRRAVVELVRLSASHRNSAFICMLRTSNNMSLKAVVRIDKSAAQVAWANYQLSVLMVSLASACILCARRALIRGVCIDVSSRIPPGTGCHGKPSNLLSRGHKHPAESGTVEAVDLQFVVFRAWGPTPRTVYQKCSEACSDTLRNAAL